MPYFLANEKQKARWLPGIASGERVTEVAMTDVAVFLAVDT